MFLDTPNHLFIPQSSLILVCIGRACNGFCGLLRVENQFGFLVMTQLVFFWLQGKIAHAVVMPSVTVEKLDDFVEELIEVRNRAFPDGDVVVPCIVEEVGPENCACSVHRDISSPKSPKEERKHFSSSNS